jgi:SHS2 domain-containing protein
VEKYIPKIIEIVKENKKIRGTLKGETFDENRHPILGTVKAVTYHQFSVRKDREILKATFIVDM